MPHLFLSIAIVAEVIGTLFLKAADGFTKLAPSVVVLVAYVTAFYFLALAIRTIPVGLAYAIWAGVGIVLIAAASYLFYGQTLDAPAILGLTLIIAGVTIVNLFSKSMPH